MSGIISDNVGRASGVIAAAGGGKVINYWSTNTGAVITASSVPPMPVDDTIPQNGEGLEAMTLAVTPSSATNILHISSCFTFTEGSGNAFWVSVGLFQDATANAISAQLDYQKGGSSPWSGFLNHKMTAGTTSETTFKVRLGSGYATTEITFNGHAGGGRGHGGVLGSHLTCYEIDPSIT